MNHRPLARTSDLVLQDSGSDTLIYDLKNNKAACLNETAAIIWKLCDGNRSVSEIEVEAGKLMKSLVNEDLVLLALDQLDNDGLLAEGFEQNEKFAGLSRREIIKKIGIGAMVALPIVSSIVAPDVIAAQSSTCLPTGVCHVFGTPLCPIGCTGTVNFTGWNTSDCSGPSFSPISLACPNGTFANSYIINSIT